MSLSYETLLAAEGCFVVIFRSWADSTRASTLFRLAQEKCVTSYPIVMYGRSVLQPRMQWCCGDEHVTSHTYSGTSMPIEAWPETVRALRRDVFRLCGIYLDSCLINYYRNGHDYIGAHRDKECVDENKMVATLSLGASRRFIYTHIQTKAKIETSLHSGDLLLMYGRTNELWKHEIPKQLKVEEPRASYSLRVMSTATAGLAPARPESA